MNITVLDETGNFRKLFKLVPYKAGGFCIILPRFVGTNIGRLEKTLVTYENLGTHIETVRDETEQYNAKDIVKFSYHADGFVQFSSATNSRIISGRNPDGTPKGLGVLSWPLNNPISTGPSMSLTIWGLDKLPAEKMEKIDKRYLFEIGKAVPHPKATYKGNDELAFAMAMYIIPNSIKGDVHEVDGKKLSNIAMMQQLPDGSAFMRLREQVTIIEIPNHEYRIGISWFFIPKKSNSEFGYMFFGPTDGKRGLVASYPAVNYGDKLLMKSIGFNPVQ